MSSNHSTGATNSRFAKPKSARSAATRAVDRLEKAPTGITGLDEVTLGGLPRGRATLICGSAGCGKTMLAVEFLVNGVREYGEPGVFVAFEETRDELVVNAASLDFDLGKLVREGKLAIDHVHIDPNEISETGDYDLEGLFIRLKYAIESVGAKRVVLDTIETLFSGFSNTALLRAEIRRLFQFLKSFGVTAIVTGERGENSLTRYGLEEYVADCVILLDHRVMDQITTRRMRIVKYRGSSHGTNEYPFIIDEQGFSVLPVTSMALRHKVSSEVISSGVPDLDAMLGVGGYYRGSTVLLSGTAGMGKSSFAAALARAACERGERVLFFAFEESEQQIVRNMRSVGINLQPHLDSGRLRIIAQRPFLYGLEMHLVSMHKEVGRFRPAVVVVDPISNLISAGTPREVTAMLTLLIDFLKTEGITGFFTVLTENSGLLETSDVGISSLIDTWMMVRDIEVSGERNRGLYVLKSRGMNHSNQIREFLLSAKGIRLVEVYLGPSGMLTGSARVALEEHERDASARQTDENDLKLAQLEHRRKAMEAHIEALRAEFEADAAGVKKAVSLENKREKKVIENQAAMARSRRANGHLSQTPNRK
ncbi:circadian clock protein KaiC [Candidatus Binatus sp.]|uniref:circadian clock protein KaiC n=1 Tax=Candidatus Binatus sp. TaxID=2811406 RepID=UPI003CAA058B